MKEDIFKASTPEEGVRRKEAYVKIMVKEWLDSGKARINPDGSYDVDGDVDLSNMNLDKIPVKFNLVGGYFYCSNNNLTSLEGCPKEVGGDFYCSYNKKQFTEEEVRSVCNVKGDIYV